MNNSTNYTFDANLIELSNGRASLKTVDQTDDDNTAFGFGGGTHAATNWTGTGLALDATGMTNGIGQFTSRVLDAYDAVTWNSLDLNLARPSNKELLTNKQSETGYAAGNVAMTNNVLYLRFNEATWAGGSTFDIIDHSGSGHEGRAMGGALPDTNGLLNSSANFDGVNDFIEIPNHSELNTGTVTSRTISLWFQATSTTARQVIYEEGGSVRGLIIYIENDLLYVGGWNRAEYFWAGTYHSTPVVAGSWTHVALRLDNATPAVEADKFKAYKNGVEFASGDGGQLYAHSGDVSIGASGDGDYYHDGSTSSGHYFGGKVDELVIFNRSLSPTEIYDVYARAGLRTKFQVRSCDDAACDTETFMGRDETPATYYSELQNTTLSPSVFALNNVANQRYFQYQITFETASATESPEIAQVDIGPSHFPRGSFELTNNSSVPFEELVEVKSLVTSGDVNFQISSTGSDWFYHNGSQWTAASDSSHTNTAAELETIVTTFHQEVGGGEFYFKALLNSDGSTGASLDQVGLVRLQLATSGYATQPSFFSREFTFDTPANYAFDGQKVEVASSQASLKSIDQTDDDGDVVTGFGAGFFSDTEYNTALELNATGLTNGSGNFTSRIMNANSTVSWTQLQIQTPFPVAKNLVDNQAAETGYTTGNVDMADNVVLLHMDEADWTSGASDTSGSPIVHNGSAQGGASTAVGLLGRAGSFDGTNDSLIISNSNEINLSGPYTDRAVSLWFQARDTTGIQMIFEEGGGTRGLNIYLDGDTLYAGGWNRAEYNWPGTYLNTTGIVADQWYHVVIVLAQTSGAVEADKFKAYLNGVEFGSGDGGQLYNHGGDVRLGASGGSRLHSGSTSSGYYYQGVIDEFAMWNRELTTTEISDIYRRGAIGYRVQVTSCDDALCDTESFMGPDGTTGTYYEPSLVSAATETIALTNVANNQYFQYWIELESLDSAFTPELTSISVLPFRYDTSHPTVTTLLPEGFHFLSGFEASTNGEATFQISNDSGTYYWHNGTNWVPAGSSVESNTIEQLNLNLSSFHQEIGAGDAYVKVFLKSNGWEGSSVQTIKILGYQ